MFGTALLIVFQIELGVLSWPGAEDREDRASAREISASESSRASLKGRRMVSRSEAGWHVKKWLRRARFSSLGVEESMRTGKRGGRRPIANSFAVQTV